MDALNSWVAPLLLLPGVGLLVVSTANRYASLHTEIHRLEDHPAHDRRRLAHHLFRRACLFRDALVALYAGVALFTFGALVAGVASAWFAGARWMAVTGTVAGVAATVYAAVQLCREALSSLKIIADHIIHLDHLDALEADDDD